MMRKALSPNSLMFFASLCAVFTLLGGAQAVRGGVREAPAARYTWAPPDHGTPVEYYVAQVLVNDVDILIIDPLPSELASVNVVYGNKYSIRVAAVDASGTQGPYSGWSDPFTPEVAPPGF